MMDKDLKEIEFLKLEHEDKRATFLYLALFLVTIVLAYITNYNNSQPIIKNILIVLFSLDFILLFLAYYRLRVAYDALRGKLIKIKKRRWWEF